MDGYYVIAYTLARRVYAMHNKVYLNRKQAENALKVLMSHGKCHGHEVYEITNMKPVEPPES